MRKFTWSLAAAALTLSGCSGGGGGTAGGGGGAGGTSNTPPSFTSAGSVTVPENTVGAIYAATASDAEGDTLTYSISGGADSSRFVIAAGGALSFLSPPNFDLPVDADGDNVYQVTLSVSDGKAAATRDVAVTVTNSKEGIAVQRISTGFVDPVAISAVPGTRKLLVAQRNGALFEVDGTTGGVTAVGNVFAGSLDRAPGSQLVTLVARPTYNASPSVMMVVQNVNGSNTAGVFRATRNIAFWPSDQVLSLGVITTSTENSAALAYAADGTTLYAALTDGSGTGTSNAAALSTTARGKIVRIVPNPDPFAGASPVYFLTSIVAWGLHQPSGATVANGELLFGDRGMTAFEELDRFVPPGAMPNYGWPFREGTQTVQAGGLADYTEPALQYVHGTGVRQGTGVVGGQVYAGSIASLANFYVFGDRTGAIFAVPIARLRTGMVISSSELEVRTQDFGPNVGTIASPIGFANDATGLLYILDSDGEVFRTDAG